ncbi:MAG TPA: F0F1 ATP synthase subunit delta, partial [Chthonomonadaceae bacterium]|nr:F0F1 ATP synthase subunit delta [Chthonomonadaceae bacterium]
AEIWRDRLRTMEPDEKRRFAASLRHARGSAVIRSAFDLPAPIREKLAQAVTQELGMDACLAFETAPDLMGGLELRTEDSKISWTLAASLSSLEKSVAELLDKEDTTRGCEAERPLLAAQPNV